MELTPTSGDGGVDVVARNGNRGLLVQCKSSTTDQPLGWGAIKEVVGGRAYYQKHYPGIEFDLACMTNASFNFYAHAQARLNSVRLIERTEIEQALQDKRITFKDVEKFIA